MQTIKSNGFTVKVVKSARRKSVALKVGKDGASIHMPNLLPLSFAEDFIAKKSSWIKSKLAQQSERQTVEKQFADGESFLLLGKPYTLRLIDTESKTSVSINDDTLYCHTRLKKVSQKTISTAITHWYKQHATDYLTQRMQDLCTAIGLSAKSVTVKTYRARWGSCTIKGDIQLNWKLIMAPPAMIDYVIIHELCHTRHHNHSPDFWHLVEHIYPNFKQAKQWFRQYGHTLEL